MSSKKRNHKILGGLIVAGVIAAGGSAFTATGLTSNAGPSQFVGGSVNQTVSGATLNDITYTFVGGGSGPRTHVDGATLEFGPDAEGRSVAMVLTSGDDDTFVCTAATDPDGVGVLPTSSSCTLAGATDGYVGATNTSVTVS